MTGCASSLVCQSIFRLLRRCTGPSAQTRWAVAKWLPPYVCFKNLLHSISPQLLFTPILSERSHQLGEKSMSRERTVFVINFKWPVTEESLRKHFEKFGEIRDFAWDEISRRN